VKALISGVLGQDGRTLSLQLLCAGWEVVGIARRSSTNVRRLEESGLPSWKGFRLITGDVADSGFVHRAIREEEPSHAYNLAAPSHVGHSFQDPAAQMLVTYGGCLNFLEAIRALPSSRRPRFYQASSSEMFGSQVSWGFDPMEHADAREVPADILTEAFQCEDTPLRPNSPYAAAKTAAHHLVRVYRESYGLFACAGILFNHEGPLRPPEFVTQKVLSYVKALRDGRATSPLRLGNLDAARDWGASPDYCRAMSLMLAASQPKDYVVATGEAHTVRQLCERAFALIGADWQEHTISDPALFRPCEVPYLRGDSTRIRSDLGWRPEVSFDGLVRMMWDPGPGARP
jgi:GDPmannose 4,6-dehydratase